MEIAARRDAIRAYARHNLAMLPGAIPLTPEHQTTTIEAFAIPSAEKRFAAALAKAGITVGLYPNRLRISPSLYNSEDDIDRLVHVLRNA